jgi:hypothetical protein
LQTSLLRRVLEYPNISSSARLLCLTQGYHLTPLLLRFQLCCRTHSPGLKLTQFCKLPEYRRLRKYHLGFRISMQRFSCTPSKPPLRYPFSSPSKGIVYDEIHRSALSIVWSSGRSLCAALACHHSSRSHAPLVEAVGSNAHRNENGRLMAVR